MGVAALLFATSSVAGARVPSAKELLISDAARAASQSRAAFAVCEGDASPSGSLLFPLSGSEVRVDFFGDGPSGNRPASGTDQHNDDDSAAIGLAFSFLFFGTSYSSAWVNNNGNLTFSGPFSVYNPDGFPDATLPPMVAPFWGDVDTGNSTTFIGDVWIETIGSEAVVITWDDVGHFFYGDTLRNTFQVAISDGTNATMGIGNNVCFSYDNMCWTTGDASLGVGGLGGYPAVVGANEGDGANFSQIGRFNHSGNDYDGPLGAIDGVDWLDDQTICFALDVAPQGACCLSNSCSTDTAPGCEALGGLYRGDLTSCGGEVCEFNEPCSSCGTGDHWIHQPTCSGDSDWIGTYRTKIGLDYNFDCVADDLIVADACALMIVNRSDPLDDSWSFPGLRSTDGHFDVIDTELIDFCATDGAVTLRAGFAQGELVSETLGALAEQPGSPALADDFFDLFFELDLGGGAFRYNHSAVRIESLAGAICTPASEKFVMAEACVPLYSSPTPGEGAWTANLVQLSVKVLPQPAELAPSLNGVGLALLGAFLLAWSRWGRSWRGVQGRMRGKWARAFRLGRE